MIDMRNGRVNDVTYCYNLGKMRSRILIKSLDEMSFRLLIRYRFTYEHRFQTIGIITLPRLAANS